MSTSCSSSTINRPSLHLSRCGTCSSEPNYKCVNYYYDNKTHPQQVDAAYMKMKHHRSLNVCAQRISNNICVPYGAPAGCVEMSAGRQRQKVQSSIRYL